MEVFSLRDAAERTGTSKVDIWRAVGEDSLLGRRTNDGGLTIDPAELFRVLEPHQPECPLGQYSTASADETACTPTNTPRFMALCTPAYRW